MQVPIAVCGGRKRRRLQQPRAPARRCRLRALRCDCPLVGRLALSHGRRPGNRRPGNRRRGSRPQGELRPRLRRQRRARLRRPGTLPAAGGHPEGPAARRPRLRRRYRRL
ncbi:hypothetical protein ACTND9_22160, partial [Paenibacillus barengoltzii]|uniref:hypothetical protein n=1 Tax=Paenibacillus barengoltzii TaxID=343517 RepID=UPI003F8A17FC